MARAKARLSGLRGAGWGDILAGLTLAAIAVPEQMATARLAGFPPHVGFIAFIAGSLAFAFFGASRFLSVGADSTIAPIFAGAIAGIAVVGTQDYFNHAILLSLMVGALLMIGGLLRAGWIADLLSVPVLTGFLAGVSIHIGLSQTPAFLGLPPEGGEPLQRVIALVRDIGGLNPTTFLIGASCLFVIVIAEEISPRIPGALIALGAAAWVVDRFDLQSQGVAVLGSLAHATPRLSLPQVGYEEVTHLVGLAVVIALVVMVQTSATSRAFPAKGMPPNIATFSASASAACFPDFSARFRSTPVHHARPSSQRAAAPASSLASSPLKSSRA